MKIFSGYVREQKRYTKNELKHIFSFDEAGGGEVHQESQSLWCAQER